MTPTTLTVEPKDIEEGDILVSDLGQRVALNRLLGRISTAVGPLETDCWLTNHSISNGGYSQVYVNGKLKMAHRLTYESLVGSIPAGLDLDHLCRVRNCVNPAHLEPVTRRENILRGRSPGANATNSGMCKRGHSLDDAWIKASGGRQCRHCAALGRLRRLGRLP